MKLENQVTSLELSKRLEKLGVKQESYFVWNCFEPPTGSLTGWQEIGTKPHHQADRYYAAFTVAELDWMISIGTDGQYCCVDNEEGSMGYRTEPFLETENTLLKASGLKLFVITGAGIMDTEPADARAKMLIYLIENKLITP